MSSTPVPIAVEEIGRLQARRRNDLTERTARVTLQENSVFAVPETERCHTVLMCGAFGLILLAALRCAAQVVS
ncbi:MAG: hypothetical protein VCF07_10560, partial [Nitrospinota bacterium]